MLLFARFFTLRHDDAYIIFQFARNLATGAGFAFNAGEPVFGSTTPLFTLLLAAIYAGFGEVLPVAAVAIGSAAVGAQSWLLYRLLARAFPATGWLAAVAALLGGLGHLAFLALETHLFLALLLATLWTLDEERPIACGVYLGLAFLCRYDAALLIPLVALWQLRQRRLPVQTLAAAAVSVLPWLTFAWLHLGALLPDTLAAKFGISGPLDYLASYAELLLSAPGLPATWPARVVALAALSSGLIVAARRAPVLLLLAAFAALHLTAYASIGPSVYQHWHMAPALLASRLFMLLGSVGLLELLPRRSTSPGWIASRRLWQVASLLLAALWCAELGRGLWRLSGSVESDYWLGGRHTRYATVASWVDRHVEVGRSFMAHEIGTLGYLTRRRMIDPFGLINETNEWPRTKEAGAFIALLRHYAPDVVLVDTPHQGRLLERYEGYHLVKVFDWDDHWTTLLVKSRSVLRDPSAFEHLRADPRTAVALAAN